MSVRALADLERGVVRAEVEIEAPPEVVFEALTDPEQLASWWGADLYDTYDWTFDLRVGGAWSANATTPTGTGRVYGEILELDRPHLLALTWHASWDGSGRTEIRYRFEPTSVGTRLVVVHQGFVGRPESCQSHTEGWEHVLGWLAAHVEGG